MKGILEKDCCEIGFEVIEYLYKNRYLVKEKRVEGLKKYNSEIIEQLQDIKMIREDDTTVLTKFGFSWAATVEDTKDLLKNSSKITAL